MINDRLIILLRLMLIDNLHSDKIIVFNTVVLCRRVVVE